MATAEQRQIERLQDKISDIQSSLDNLEYELGELRLIPDDEHAGDNEPLTCEVPGFEWTFSKLEGAKAFDLLDQIGLNPARKYNLIEVEQIRLAIEHILG